MSDNAKNAYGFLKSLGYTDSAAAGIVGNLTAESGGNLNTRQIHDNGTGLGIAGWRDPEPGRGRKTDLVNFAADKQLDVYDLKTQLLFLDHELKTKETGVYSRLMKAKSPSEAALAFISFERPKGWSAANPAGGHNWSGRNANAVNLYNQNSGSDPVQLADVASFVPQSSQTSLDDTSPVDPFTTTEQRNARLAGEKDAAGFFGAAVESNWDASPIKWAMQGAERFEPDADFRWRDKQDLLNEVTKGVPREHWSAFEEATSEAHAHKIRERIDTQLDLQRRIGAGGWKAGAGALLGEMLEPVGLAASFAIPEVTLPAKAGRITRAAVGALGAAAGNVALELPRYATKETATATDLLWAGGTGLALGGAFGALRKNPALQAEADSVERVGKGLRRQVQEDLNGSTAITSPGSSVGAQAVNGRQSLHPEMDAWFDEGLEAHETALGALRFDSTGQLKSSPSPVARAAGGKLGLDAVGNKDKTQAVDFAASEYQSRTHDGMMDQLAKEYSVSREAYFKEKDVAWHERNAAEVQLRSEVTSFIRNQDPSRATDFSPAVQRMGAKIRKLTAEYADLLRNPGKMSGKELEPVPGFENLEPNPNYVMRQVDHQKVSEKTSLHGDAQIADAYERGLLAANPELKPELAKKIATGYLKRLRQLSAGVDMKGDRAAAGHDPEALREMLEEFDLKPDEVASVLDMFKPKVGDDAGATPRAKHRALYDDNFAVPLKVTDASDPRFGQTVEFKLSDLFEDDAVELFENYSRQVSGLLGLHQVRVKNPKFTPDHVRPMARPGVEVRASDTKPDIVSPHGELNLRVDGDKVVVDKATLKGTDAEGHRALLEAAADYASSRGKTLASGSQVDNVLADAFKALKGDWKVKFAEKATKTDKVSGLLVRNDDAPVFRIQGEWKAPSNEPEELIRGLSKDADWDRLFARLGESWDELVTRGEKTHDERVKGLKADTANLEFLRDQVLGRTDKIDQSTWGKSLRRLRDYNFLRLMNNVGLAQLTEFFFATSSVGLKAAISGMPAFKHLLRNARTGELDDAIARDIEYLTSYGTDHVRGKLLSLVDDNGGALNATNEAGLGQKFDHIVAKGKQVTNQISGMTAINTALQRFAARAVYAKFAHMADGAAVNAQRLTAMGINPQMSKRIFAQINKHKSFIEGASGKSDLPRMNLEKWDDAEAAAAFQMGVTRWAKYAVLKNDPGAMSRMVGTWFGKTVFQFRSFVMGAWSRHLLHNIHMKDWNTITTFLFTGLGGVLTHIAHSHLVTLGRSDRQEELEKRLSWKNLVFNGFARTSYSSFLPAAWDTGATALGFDPVFTRVSGQATDAILGNPTVGLINDTRKGIAGMFQTAISGDNDLSQADVRNVAKAFPYQNWIPFQALMSTMVSDLPEVDKRGRK